MIYDQSSWVQTALVCWHWFKYLSFITGTTFKEFHDVTGWSLQVFSSPKHYLREDVEKVSRPGDKTVPEYLSFQLILASKTQFGILFSSCRGMAGFQINSKDNVFRYFTSSWSWHCQRVWPYTINRVCTICHCNMLDCYHQEDTAWDVYNGFITSITYGPSTKWTPSRSLSCIWVTALALLVMKSTMNYELY